MKWLHRDLIVGPYVGLALSEAHFQRAMRHCKVPKDDWPAWINAGCDATAHTLTNPEGNMVCIVCIAPAPTKTPIQIAALLVHEAVHVWQKFRESIGEDRPSHEFEAYAIQSISQRLMTAYAETARR